MRDETAILRSTHGEAMSLLGVTARGKAVGLHFELAVEQRYRNATTANLEVVYTFPLPLNAVLLDLEVCLGGKTLKGVVVEKSAGEAQYEAAIDKGDTAILLELAGDGLYTVNFGNLMAGEEATITYRYGERLRFEHGTVRLTIPTVIAPRYGDAAAAGLQPHQVPSHDLAQDYPFSLTLELLGPVALGTLESPSHAIAVSPTEGGAVVTLTTSAHLDRDFVLVASKLAAKSFAVVAPDGDEVVAMASFCVNVPADQAQAPLRLKLLLDCSGSMGGDSIAAAKRALHEILSRLEPQDRFSLTRFGSSVVHVTPALRCCGHGGRGADGEGAARGRSRPRRHRDGAGTGGGVRPGRSRRAGRCPGHHRWRGLGGRCAGRPGPGRAAAGLRRRHRQRAGRRRAAQTGAGLGRRLRVHRAERRGAAGDPAHVPAPARAAGRAGGRSRGRANRGGSRRCRPACSAARPFTPTRAMRRRRSARRS